MRDLDSLLDIEALELMAFCAKTSFRIPPRSIIPHFALDAWLERHRLLAIRSLNTHYPSLVSALSSWAPQRLPGYELFQSTTDLLSCRIQCNVLGF